MWFPKIILGLFATASALDIHLFLGRGCTDNITHVICEDASPGRCCSGSPVQIFPSIGFFGIVESWSLQCRGFADTCGRLMESQTASGVNFKCLEGGPFASTSYIFNGKKRADGSDESCTEYQKPNTLVLGDGSKYNITDMEDAPLTELVCPSQVPIYSGSRILINNFTI